MKKARLTSAGHLVELEFLQAFFFNKKYTLEVSYSHDEDTKTTQSVSNLTWLLANEAEKERERLRTRQPSKRESRRNPLNQPENSSWYKEYLCAPAGYYDNPTNARDFRNQFRVSWYGFLQIVNDARRLMDYDETRVDAIGRKVAP
jgi:hypothetical protein